MIILGIETSCDETAASLVEDGVHEISSALATSADLHQKTGGIVPEVAARKQVESIIPVINECFEKASLTREHAISKIDAIAVTVGPGLIGSLVVGVETAKALSLAWNKPLIPVNHLVGHIYGNFVDSPTPVEFPCVVLIVSGGHTDLILMRDHNNLEYIGGTLDDAAGEAFDKTARLLGLSKYLGGPLLSKLSASCTNPIFSKKLPRPMLKDSTFDFSFSGLKTAVKHLIETTPQFDTSQTPIEEYDLARAALALEFETAVVDVLVHKTLQAVKKFGVKTVLLAGGVSANTMLRSRMKLEAESLGVTVHVPPLRLCTDNAIYIASAAYFGITGMEQKFDTQFTCQIKANPSLSVIDR